MTKIKAKINRTVTKSKKNGKAKIHKRSASSTKQILKLANSS